MERLSRKARNLLKISKSLSQFKTQELKEKVEKKAEIYVKTDIQQAYDFALSQIEKIKGFATEQEFDKFMGENSWRIDNLNLGQIWFALKQKIKELPPTPAEKPADVPPVVEEPVKEEPKPEEVKKEEPVVEKQEAMVTAEKHDKLWIVTRKFSDDSTLADICFEADAVSLEKQYKGGLKGEDVEGIYSTFNEAKEHAEKILKGESKETPAEGTPAVEKKEEPAKESLRQPKPQEDIKPSQKGASTEKVADEISKFQRGDKVELTRSIRNIPKGTICEIREVNSPMDGDYEVSYEQDVMQFLHFTVHTEDIKKFDDKQSSKTVNKINKVAWQGKLQDNYDGDIEQFKKYDEIYNIAGRLGFDSAEEAWEENPTINVGTDPSELKVIEGEEKVEGAKATPEIKKRLEEIRKELRKGKISYGELSELQSLAKYIEKGDVELLEAAGVPEFPEDKDASKKKADDEPKKEKPTDLHEVDRKPTTVDKPDNIAPAPEDVTIAYEDFRKAQENVNNLKARIQKIADDAAKAELELKTNENLPGKETEVKVMVDKLASIMEKENLAITAIGDKLIELEKHKDKEDVDSKAEQIMKVQKQIQKLNEKIIAINNSAEPIAKTIYTRILHIFNKTKTESSVKEADGNVMDLLGDLYSQIRGLFIDTKEIHDTI